MVGHLQRRWTPNEISILSLGMIDGIPQEVIARELDRDIYSIRNRLQLDNRRRRARAKRPEPTRIRIEVDNIEVRPPLYVLRERSVRRQLSPRDNTAALQNDPLPGYSAQDANGRGLSVQDALEIGAQFDGKLHCVRQLAFEYRVSDQTIRNIISGEWFDQLLPKEMR